MKTINDQLRQKYIQVCHKLITTKDAVEGESVTNPCLLYIPDQFLNAQIKVMIFGKESRDWVDEFPCKPSSQVLTDHLISTYKNYYISQINFKGSFKNGYIKFEKLLEKNFKSENLSFIFNDVIKVGKHKHAGKPSAKVLDWQEEFFEVIQAETKLLKPNIVLFFTGPGYDEEILKSFPDAQFEDFNDSIPKKELAIVKSKALPKCSYRTYHPGYSLSRNTNKDYLEKIVQHIVQHSLLSETL